MPAALTYPLHDPRFNWRYETEPQAAMGGRRLYWPRGRVLGGSSSINGMVWIRGHARDYDEWYEAGLPGWAYCQLLPYFKRMETSPDGDPAYRGKSGPVRVVRGRNPNPLFEAFIACGEEAGFGRTPDFNGRSLEGFGRYDMNISGGRRQSAAVTHLRPAARRPNLTVLTDTLVLRLLTGGNRVTGVEYAGRDGVARAGASSETLLCGGTINSAQLLLLSGYGDPAQLRPLGIEVKAELPGVGRNLHDHLVTSVKYECTQPITLHGADRFPRKALVGLEYLLFKTGAGATMHQEAGSFVRFAGGDPLPDAQHYLLPLILLNQGKTPSDRHGYQAYVAPCKPTSRGTLTLRSADPRAAPALQPAALQTERDRRILRQSLKLTREIMEQKSLAPYRGRLLYPDPAARDDAALDAYIDEFTFTCYHPVGTCRMGTDAEAVVDAACRVHGVAGLRVVDASIFPTVPSGNLNAPVMTTADKIADHILGRAPLPPEDVVIDGYQPIKAASVAANDRPHGH
jgi:choline dehydrogenase